MRQRKNESTEKKNAPTLFALSSSSPLPLCCTLLSLNFAKRTPASRPCSAFSSSSVMHCFSADALDDAPGGRSTTAWLTRLDERATTRAPASSSFSWSRARAASSSAVELAEASKATTPARGSDMVVGRSSPVLKPLSLPRARGRAWELCSKRKPGKGCSIVFLSISRRKKKQ